MKTLRKLIPILLILLLASTVMAATKTYMRTALTGGASGALDAIDGANLSDSDKAEVRTADTAYHYRLNATSGAAESSPDVISPDSNAGNKRWILLDVIGPDLSDLTDDSMADTLHRHSELSASDGSPNPALSVDASGNIGIGVTTPDADLTIVRESAASVGIKSHYASPWGPAIIGYHSRGTEGTPAVPNNGDSLLRLYAIPYDGVDYASQSASIIFKTDGLMAENDTPGQIVFATTADGAAAPTDRMTIDEAGNVGIGTTSPEAKLHIDTGVSDSQIKIGTLGGLESILAINDADSAYKPLRIDADDLLLNSYASGDVAIGTSAPDGKLHVHTATAGSVSADATGDDLVVESNGSGGMSILTPDASLGVVYFGSPTDSIGGLITYQQSTGLFSVGSHLASGQVVIKSGNGVEAARFDSSGDMSMPSGATITVGVGADNGTVSAGVFTDRTRFFEGDAIAAIKAIKGHDGEIDHSTLPEFCQKTGIIRNESRTPGPRMVIDPKDAWEEYTEEKEEIVTEMVWAGEDTLSPIVQPKIKEIKTKYRIDGEKVVEYTEGIPETKVVVKTKKRLKKGIKFDETTGELYRQDDVVEVTETEEPRRDLGASISVNTVAIQQLITLVETQEQQIAGLQAALTALAARVAELEKTEISK